MPKPCSLSTRATDWLRGLCRLLPAPCAKSTTPDGFDGTIKSPFNLTRPAGIDTDAGAVPEISSLTSSSVVAAKSTYHWPTAQNASGCWGQTTSSTVPLSSSTVDGAPTGTATTIARWTLFPNRQDGGSHGRARREAVIDQHNGSLSYGDSVASGPVRPLAPLDLARFSIGNRFDGLFRDPVRLDHFAVDDDGAVGCDSPHGKLFLARHAQLANDAYIEWRA